MVIFHSYVSLPEGTSNMQSPLVRNLIALSLSNASEAYMHSILLVLCKKQAKWWQSKGLYPILMPLFDDVVIPSQSLLKTPLWLEKKNTLLSVLGGLSQ